MPPDDPRAAQKELGLSDTDLAKVLTPDDLRAAQKELGLSDADLAKVLRLGKHGDRTVRYWKGDEAARGVPGPVQVAVEYLLAERRRRDGKKLPAR